MNCKRVSLWLSTLFMPIIFVYFEVLLRAFSGQGIAWDFVYPLLFGLSSGLFFYALFSFLPPIASRVLTSLLLAAAAFVFTVECLMHGNFQMYMEPESILRGAGSVIDRYGDNFSAAILGGIPKILLFFLPVVVYLVLGGKLALAPKKQAGVFFSTITVIISVFLYEGALTAVHFGGDMVRYRSEYQFDSATETFGLLTGLRMSVPYTVFGKTQGDGFLVEQVPTEDSEVQESETTQIAAADTEDTESEMPTEEAPVPIEYGVNRMEIDFDAETLADRGKMVAELNQYVQSLTPSDQNEYTGLFAGKNLILICAEAFCDAVINEELTPTLYRLSHNGIYFSDYYQPAWGGSTSTGEFSFLMGLVPRAGLDSVQKSQFNNNYFTLGNQLQRLDYRSDAYHNGWYDYYDRNLTHCNFGYDRFLASGNGLEKLVQSYAPDSKMLDKTIDEYIEQGQPFNLYYMTLSGHCSYKAESPYVQENLAKVLEIYGDTYKDKTNYYICYQMELEKALCALVAKLEAAGIADDTVICLTGDHYPYGLEKNDAFGTEENYLLNLYGHPYSTWERDHSAWILWSGCLENEYSDHACEISTPTYSLDIVPTLSNLFGLTYDSRLLVGRDVFSNEQPLVIWNNYSWITDVGCYDSRKRKFTPNEGCEYDEEYVERINAIVHNKIRFSYQVIECDYYGVLFGADTPE